MSENLVNALQSFIGCGYDLPGVKRCLEATFDNDGNGSFEYMATQRVLAELKTLLVDEDDEPAAQNCSFYFDSATGQSWNNGSEFYKNALILIEMIDPPKGSITADYSKPLLMLFTQKLENGDFHGLETISILCRYATMHSFQQKQLIDSYLTGAKYWLDNHHFQHATWSLDFVRRTIDPEHHPKTLQKLQEIQDLIDQRSRKPSNSKYDGPQILQKLDELKCHIEIQTSFHFTPSKSNENSWRRQGAQEQSRKRQLQ